MKIFINYKSKSGDDLPFVCRFPNTKFNVNLSNRTIEQKKYDEIEKVEFCKLNYISSLKWNFEKELEKMFDNKNVFEIEKIVEQLQIIEYFNFFAWLEDSIYNSKDGKKYEDVLQELIKEIKETDEKGYLIPEELL